MNLEQETKFILKKYNAQANKSYGQNFLIDQNVVDEILEKAEVNSEDLIIEIGPGLGSLTAPLLGTAGKVICIELDPKMVAILKVDLNKIIEENCQFKSAKVVANLPYYITTPIIMKLLEDKLNLESITVMVQKEVADRLADKPGGKDVGAITYSINYYTNPEIIIDVPRYSFIPAPNVDSAVIKLNVLKEPKVKVLDEELFFKVVKFAFLQKRKTLMNSLSNSGLVSKEFIERMLNELEIDLRVRAEQLSLEQFGEITDYIKNNKII